jgi:signal transduction histidine kinase
MPPAPVAERRQFQLDPMVRGEVARQCFYYWVAYLSASLLFLSAWIGCIDQPQTVASFWQRLNTLALPALVSSTLLLPLVFFHSIRFGNRFSGPLYRMRKTLTALSRGETVDHVALRKDDYWQEFAGDIERVSRYIEQLQRELEEAQAGASDYRNFIRNKSVKPASRPLAHSS